MKITLTMAAALIAFPALSQERYSYCDSVLSYTGREKKLVQSLDIESEWKKYLTEEAQSLGINILNYASLDWGQNSKNHGEQVNSYYRSYLRSEESVFLPAVQAWRACIDGLQKSGLQIVAKIINADLGELNNLQVDISPTPDSNPLLQGVVFDSRAVSCSSIGAKFNISQNMERRLPYDRVTSISCKRKPGNRSKQSISITLGGRTHYFSIPAIAGSPRLLPDLPRDRLPDRGEFEVVHLTGGTNACEDRAVIRPAPYNRQVYARGTLDGEWRSKDSTAILRGYMNKDIELLSKSFPKTAEKNPRGRIEVSSSSPKWLQAFEPGLVHVTGGIGPDGSCLGINVKVVVAK